MRRQDPPLKVVRAFALDQGRSGALVHLNNVSGGVLAGDRLVLDVEVEGGGPRKSRLRALHASIAIAGALRIPNTVRDFWSATRLFWSISRIP